MIQQYADRFWAKVTKGEPRACWPWSGAKKPKGYGNVRINKRYLITHRVAWELSNGPIPAGMHVLHSCDNPACCNPSHLMLGTAMANFVDMDRKGRCRANHDNRRFGMENHNGKLTADQVDEIRRRYIPGKVRQQDLADEYGVTQPEISAVVLRKVRVNG